MAGDMHSRLENAILLGLLHAVAENGDRSQRGLASDLNIALGLVNASLKHCVKKGFVRVGKVPARRYAYYLTPRGFAEKSRLSVGYLASSFSFFRQARADCAFRLQALRAEGKSRIAFWGLSELTEIAILCALDCGIEIVAIIDERTEKTAFAGVAIARKPGAVADRIDFVFITDLQDPASACKTAIKLFGPGRVYAPDLLRMLLMGKSGHIHEK